MVQFLLKPFFNAFEKMPGFRLSSYVIYIV